MKKLIFAGMISCFIISCSKERMENIATQNAESALQNTDSLHPLGVEPDDPSLLGKVGYYKRDAALKQEFISSVDLSGNMPLVGNQGRQKSCVGWAVGYYCKSYHENVEKKWWYPNENTFSPSWIYNQINGGNDHGSSIGSAMNLLVDNGCDFKDNFPYSSADFTTKPDNGSKANAKHYKSSSWHYVQKNVNEFKSILASSQVLIINIPVYPDFDHLNSGNQIYDDWSGTSRGNHAICVVGYDDSRQAFKIINSWGTGWGLSGYGWIAYSKIPSINNAYLLFDKANVYDTNYLTGDFNGDNYQDIFTANGYGWYVSWGGKSGLKRINTSGTTTGSLAIGDFNGDGRSDVFNASGSDWKISYSGTGAWTVINTTTIAMNTLKLGDFNGDGKADIFHVADGVWKVSYSGTSPWSVINTSGVAINNLALTDFNGDGKSDVFGASGGTWKISYSGTGKWVVINTTILAMNTLKLGDFNGDGKADIFHSGGGQWKVSYSGTSPWSIINTSGITASSIALCDLNGDGKADVFYPTTSAWKVSWSGTSPWDTL